MNNPLKIVFAGTPEFAATTLQALINSDHNVVAVYTQPDRPAGRGRKLTPSSVKTLALQHDLPVEQPLSLKDPESQKKLSTFDADIMIVVAYGLLLPETVLQSFPLGAINIHGSILPRWRGAAPIQRAIHTGDVETGVAIMQMEKGLDTGPVFAMEKIKIETNDTSGTLHDKLALLGAKTLIQTLPKIASGELKAERQDDHHASYAHKIKKEEAKINWGCSAKEIDQTIRAFNPWPIASTVLGDLVVRLWHSELIEDYVIENVETKPGTILNADSKGIDVATQAGVIRLLTLQFPGGKALPAKDILNAKNDILKPGVLFE